MMIVVAVIAGCALTLERPVEPFQSDTIEVAPNAWFESCVFLDARDRLVYSYLSDPPTRFSIRRHIGNSDVSYVVRELAREDSGVFLVPETEEYCLRWTPVPSPEVTWPTLLRYSIRLNNRP